MIHRATTPAARAWWAEAEANAAGVESWPAWKRAGINVADERSEARTMSKPKLPTLRQLTKELRELHEAWSHPDAGGEYVGMACLGGTWRLCLPGTHGSECIPGDGQPFDAVAAARRLLAAVSDAGETP